MYTHVSKCKKRYRKTISQNTRRKREKKKEREIV
jgi:hypothetical protein